MSTINELYHYGVKGMKWKNHRYAIEPAKNPEVAAELLKRRRREDIEAVSRDITRVAQRTSRMHGRSTTGHGVGAIGGGHELLERDRSRMDRLRSKIGERKNKLKRKVAGLRDRVSEWMDGRRNLELRDHETGKKTAYKKNGKWYSAKDRAKKTKANGSGTKKAMSRAAGYTKA